MKALGTKLVFRLIGIACFLAAFNLAYWLLDSDKYEFTVKGSLLAPLIGYAVASLFFAVSGRLTGKKKRKKE